MERGAAHETVTKVLPAAPTTDSGALGAVRGVIWAEANEAGPKPAELSALTVKV